MATVAWVNWFNGQRLRSALDCLSPIEFVEDYDRRQDLLRQAA